MSAEGIRRLIEKEKESEEQLKKAEEEASHIVEQAKWKAKAILSDVENERHLKALLEQEMKKIEAKKRTWETECNEALEGLKRTANENTEKTVTCIVKYVFGEWKLNGRPEITDRVSE